MWFPCICINNKKLSIRLIFQSQLLSLPDLGIMDEGMFPPELSILRNANPLPKPSARDSPTQNRFPFPFLPSKDKELSFPPLTPSLEERDHQAGGPKEQQRASNVGFSVQCEKNKMVVSIDKETLQVTGKITYAQILRCKNEYCVVTN